MGKAEQVRVYRPVAPLARLGIDLTRARAGRYVGRDELATLQRLFDAAVAERSLRFATIVGVPGLGKSRLAAELLAYVDAQPMLVTWRQGRCLPYGAGISFWALGEIVKAHAGILESDPVGVATAKLDGVLPSTDERGWFRERLLPLLGVGSGIDVERAEQFAAWRRFLEHLAAERPTVLVFEDLHWADAAMLAFLEELPSSDRRRAPARPGTTRPELDEGPASPGRVRSNQGRPSTPARRRGERTGVEPPRDQGSCTSAPRPDPGARRGQPAVHRGIHSTAPRSRPARAVRRRPAAAARGRDPARPRSIQALSPLVSTPAARPEAAAGVRLGRRQGLLGRRGGGDGSVTRRRSSAPCSSWRYEFVRPSERSSMGGEREYAFWHVLAGRCVRGAPAGRTSIATCRCSPVIESKAVGRIEDVADVLAHHYSTALDLARATGDDAQSTALQARLPVPVARRRARELDVPLALGLLERAIALTPEGHPDRPRTRTPRRSARERRPRRGGARRPERGGARTSPQATAVPPGGRWPAPSPAADSDFGWTDARETVANLEVAGPSLALGRALLRFAIGSATWARYDECRDYLRRIRDLAEAIEATEPMAAQSLRAGALSIDALSGRPGDLGGLDDFRKAIELGTAAGDGDKTLSKYLNYAFSAAALVGPETALRIVEEGLAFARPRGLLPDALFLEVNQTHFLYDAGLHDRALAGDPGDRSTARGDGFDLGAGGDDVQSGPHSDAPR